MRIDLNEVLLDLDCNVIEEARKSGEVKKLTLKFVCVNSLLTISKEDMSINGVEKNERYLLALKLSLKDTIELKVEEIVKIKDAIGKVYLPLVVGRAWELLEGEIPKEKEVEKTK